MSAVGTPSGIIGLLIIFGASLVRLPQIYTIVKYKTIEGLDFSSFALQTFVYVVNMAYGIRHEYPFLGYGENTVLYNWSLIILCLMTYHDQLRGDRRMFLIHAFWTGSLLLFWVLLLLTTIITDEFINAMTIVAVVVHCVSNIPQIVTAFVRGDTGSLSSVMVFLMMAGNLLRIYTTYEILQGDKLILSGTIIGAFFNACLFVQTMLSKYRVEFKLPKSTLAYQKLKEPKYENELRNDVENAADMQSHETVIDIVDDSKKDQSVEI